MKTRQVAPMVYLLHLSDLHFVKNALSYSTEELLLREAAEKLRGVPAGQKLLVLTGDFHNYRDPDYGRAATSHDTGASRPSFSRLGSCH